MSRGTLAVPSGKVDPVYVGIVKSVQICFGSSFTHTQPVEIVQM